MADGTNDWRELREFRGVDLLNSYVLSWDVVADSLKIDIDICLQAEHPFYEPPRPAEKFCIRAGTLEFPHCSDLNINDVQRGEPQIVVAGLTHGKVDGLRRIDDGQYQFFGAFGRVTIESERPLLRLKDSVY